MRVCSGCDEYVTFARTHTHSGYSFCASTDFSDEVSGVNAPDFADIARIDAAAVPATAVATTAAAAADNRCRRQDAFAYNELSIFFLLFSISISLFLLYFISVLFAFLALPLHVYLPAFPVREMPIQRLIRGKGFLTLRTAMLPFLHPINFLLK